MRIIIFFFFYLKKYHLFIVRNEKIQWAESNFHKHTDAFKYHQIAAFCNDVYFETGIDQIKSNAKRRNQLRVTFFLLEIGFDDSDIQYLYNAGYVRRFFIAIVKVPFLIHESGFVNRLFTEGSSGCDR